MDDPAPSAPAAQFPATLWTHILCAGGDTSPDALAAFERLARAYWPPLHAWLLRQGVSHADAEDLTQSFFAHLIGKRVLQRLRRDKGRFRTFLLTALRNHLRDGLGKASAQKRGGGHEVSSLDEAGEDGAPLWEPAGGSMPDAEFDRDWALTLLGRVVDRLRADCETSGRGALFTHLQTFLYGDADAASHTEAARRLGMSESAVKTAGTRLRQRYQELIRAEIRQTVDTDAEVEAELRDLFAAVKA